MWVPLAFGLLPGRAERDYNSFFQILKSLVEKHIGPQELRIRKVICDFERAIHNAVSDNFGEDTDIMGCFFHFSQCIWRRTQNAGMVKNYCDKKSQIRKFVTCVVALAHVPPNRLKEAYHILKNFKFTDIEEIKFKDEMTKYINQQWINNSSMPVARWNVWKRKAHLTNNAQVRFFLNSL